MSATGAPSITRRPPEIRPAESAWSTLLPSRSILTISRFRNLAHRFAAIYLAAAILGLNAVLLFAGLELASMAAMKTRLWLITREPVLVGEGAARERVSYYKTQDWGQLYWHEFLLSRKQRYYPYVAWRRAPFAGQTINIDDHGIRQTPGADCRPGAYKVFAFGGSTMWGTGAPDWGTIAARLQGRLEERRPEPVCVTNFGETGYVSTQSLVMLLLQLKLGNVPNAVVFYDGPNDVYAAYQAGRVGVHENFYQIAALFEEPLKGESFRELLQNTYSYAVVDALVGKFTSRREQPQVTVMNYQSIGVDAAALGDMVVQNYLSNYTMVDVLARRFGFETFMFIQPILSMGNKPLTQEEQQMKWTYESDRALAKLDAAVYRAFDLEASRNERLTYLANIFDETPVALWIDDSHVNPLGNDLIAETMVDAIMAKRPARRTARSVR